MFLGLSVKNLPQPPGKCLRGIPEKDLMPVDQNQNSNDHEAPTNHIYAVEAHCLNYGRQPWHRSRVTRLYAENKMPSLVNKVPNSCGMSGALASCGGLGCGLALFHRMFSEILYNSARDGDLRFWPRRNNQHAVLSAA